LEVVDTSSSGPVTRLSYRTVVETYVEVVIEITVAVPASGTYDNSATAEGSSTTGVPTIDKSTVGADPDPDDNGDPSDNDTVTSSTLIVAADPDIDLGNLRGEDVTVDPLVNDSDNTDPTTVELLDPDTGEYVKELVVPGEGTWSVNPADGNVTFLPEDDFDGDPTPVDYRVLATDGAGYAYSNITITYVDPPPPPPAPPQVPFAPAPTPSPVPIQSPSPTPTPSPAPPLAVTGSNSSFLVLTGALLSLTGGVLLLTGRRRENEA